MPWVQIPASICESLGTWVHLTMPPFPQLWNGYNKVPTLLNCCVIKWPSVLTERSEQCLVQGKNPASVSYLSVIRAWHKAYGQCVLVPLVVFSCSRSLNGSAKVRRVHFQINWPFLSKCWGMVTFKNSGLCFALLCFALHVCSDHTVLTWSLSFLRSPITTQLTKRLFCLSPYAQPLAHSRYSVNWNGILSFHGRLKKYVTHAFTRLALWRDRTVLGLKYLFMNMP